MSETREAQEELRTRIDDLSDDLDAVRKLQTEAAANVDLDRAINKLNNAKKRVVVVTNLLQGAQVSR